MWRHRPGLGTVEPRTPFNPFAPPRKSYLARSREKEKDPLRAAWAAKGLGRRATLALPDVPDAPYVEHRVGGFIGPLKQATYSPFDYRHSTTEQTKTSTQCVDLQKHFAFCVDELNGCLNNLSNREKLCQFRNVENATLATLRVTDNSDDSC